MAKKEYSAYQKDVIGRYYENQEAISLQSLQEIVSELYLAESATKVQKLWERAHKAMVRLKIQPAIIQHIMTTQNIEILAKNVTEWLSKKP
jgi:hypothetical protein